jgi:hypothetical protein
MSLVSQAFVSEQAVTSLGKCLADCLYETANRPGFLRRIVWCMDNHTVPEFSEAEYLFISRIQRRRHLHCWYSKISREGIRTMIYRLRETNV